MHLWSVSFVQCNLKGNSCLANRREPIPWARPCTRCEDRQAVTCGFTTDVCAYIVINNIPCLCSDYTKAQKRDAVVRLTRTTQSGLGVCHHGYDIGVSYTVCPHCYLSVKSGSHKSEMMVCIERRLVLPKLESIGSAQLYCMSR